MRKISIEGGEVMQAVRIAFKPSRITSYDTDIIFSLASRLKGIVGCQTVLCYNMQYTRQNRGILPTSETLHPSIIQFQDTPVKIRKMSDLQTFDSFQNRFGGAPLQGVVRVIYHHFCTLLRKIINRFLPFCTLLQIPERQ